MNFNVFRYRKVGIVLRLRLSSSLFLVLTRALHSLVPHLDLCCLHPRGIISQGEANIWPIFLWRYSFSIPSFLEVLFHCSCT